VRPVPRFTGGRLSPSSPALAPRPMASPRPSCPSELAPQHLS
jgi:hypothetical protein